VGKTGDEVNRHLDGIDLPVRSEWFVTCLIKQWAGKDGEYSNADIERDAPELYRELTRVKPKLIVTLGRASARYFLGDVDMDEVNGMSYYLPTTWEGPTWWKKDSRPVVHSVYNPAAGFRVPDIQAKVWDGFRQLGFLLADKVSPRELFFDEFEGKEDYRRLSTPLEVSGILYRCAEVHIDTEGLPGRKWSLQFALKPGQAFLIRESDAEAMAAFFWGLQRWNPIVTYHGSLHDFSIMREFMQQLGVPLDILYDLRFDDTQIMAYVLQLEPIGLKPNGVRHCGMTMREYMEVLGDAQHQHALNYIIKLFDAEVAEWRVRCRDAFEEALKTPLRDKSGKVKRNKKTGEVQYRRVTKVPKLPMSELHKAAKRVLRSENPFKLWQDQREDILVGAYNKEVEG
jgi:uracil-DNA glycosylase family 4